MTLVELTEYGTTVLDGSTLALDELASTAGSRLALSRLSGGLVEVKAGADVGVIVTSEYVVRIRPKVDLNNLFYMLGIGDKSWTVDRNRAAFDVDDDLVTAVVRLFCREVETLTGRGLLHGYVPQEERLLALRGRVDLNEVMRHPWTRSPVPCAFDEFVPDIWPNRVLLAALAEVRGVPELPPRLRGEVHLLTQRFEGVRRTPITIEDIDRWRPNRNEKRYSVAIALAGVILRHLSLKDREGAQRATSFTINMNQLFEEFVGRELRVRLPHHLALAEQYPTFLDTGSKMPICPDFVVHPSGQPEHPLYVADAKYKLTESLGVTSDHYQLLSYATVFGLSEGTLIYCQKADEDAPLDVPRHRSIRVRGTGIEHFVYRLDVSGTRRDIDARLDELTEWLLHRIAANNLQPLDEITETATV